MKTRTLKSIAIAAISLMTLTVYAQNTKSIKMVSYTPTKETSSRGNDLMSYLNGELKQYISKLAEYTRFYPNNEVNMTSATEESLVMENLVKELETSAKYNPEESLAMKSDEAAEFEKIQNELKSVVKYVPSLETESPSQVSQDDFAEIQKELKEVAQYKPANIQ